ncbi:MAG: hypothetical protein LBP55_09575, partial [Candidatus Adiutrix sp.]|nr:hypothetical protein [Candidatus Adiutrix sp.]
MRLAAKAAETSAEESYLALTPQRWGSRPWQAGEITRLRLLLGPENMEAVRPLLMALQAGGIGEGEFTAGGSLALTGLTCPGLALPLSPSETLASFLTGEVTPAPLDENDLWPEMAALQKIAETGWDLEIAAPLRLSRPVAAPGSGEYAGPDFFDWPGALSHLLARVRLPGAEEITDFSLGKHLTV